MIVTSELMAELRSKPIGPAVRETVAQEDFVRKVEVSGPNASIEATDVLDTSDGTALDFLEAEGLNPTDWEVTGFRRSEWEQGDTVRQSVRFTYKRVALAEAAVDASLSAGVIERCRFLLDGLEGSQIASSGLSGTYVVLIADPQFGKKGTAEAVANYRRGILGHKDEIDRLAEDGTVDAIHIAWQGDETEGVANNYANQAYTIELNQSQQLELDYELRVWALKELLDLELPITCSSVISNHGEWTRNGSKDVVTSKGDNASTYVARQVKALFDELEPHTGYHIDWFIGDDSTPGLAINLAGVDCYFSHGYIEKGKGGSTELRTKGAIERQILGKTEELGGVQLWFMAHYHHLYTNEFEGRTLFGCPALEAEKSSEYMLDQYGVWSPPGMLGVLVSSEFSRGWSTLNVF